MRSVYRRINLVSYGEATEAILPLTTIGRTPDATAVISGTATITVIIAVDGQRERLTGRLSSCGVVDISGRQLVNPGPGSVMLKRRSGEGIVTVWRRKHRQRRARPDRSLCHRQKSTRQRGNVGAVHRDGRLSVRNNSGDVDRRQHGI